MAPYIIYVYGRFIANEFLKKVIFETFSQNYLVSIKNGCNFATLFDSQDAKLRERFF